MDTPNPPPTKEELFVVEDWPMGLEATREQLNKAQKRLKRYQAALRLAGVEIERRNRGIVALTTFAYQASRTINSVALLKLALVQALETTGASVGATVLINTETKALTLGVHKGLTPQLVEILTGQELGHGATALMPHLANGLGALLEYQTTDDELEQQLLRAGRLTSLVSLPLQLGPRLLGAFLIGLQGKNTFTPAELCFLMALSQEIAIALEGLRIREGLWHTAETFLGGEVTGLDLQTVDGADLTVNVSTPFDLPVTSSTTPQPAEDDLEQLLAAMMEAEDEVQQQNADLQTLNNIADMMNRTLNLKEILQCAVDQTKVTLNTDAAWLYLLDEKRHLAMKAHIGLSKSYVQAMGQLELKDGVEAGVVIDNKAKFIEAIREANQPHKIWVDKEGIYGLAVVPITRPDLQTENGQNSSHVIGILATGTIAQGPHAWSPREMRLLTSIANQVAPAIDNARLYEKLKDGEAGLRAGNEVLRTVNDMLLEKTAFLEGFIHDDLTPTLTGTLPLLQNLVTDNPDAFTETQKQGLAAMQEAVNRLSNLAQEATDVSQVLDHEFDKVFSDEDRSFAGPTKPIRLEKKSDKSSKRPDLREYSDSELKPTNLAENNDNEPNSRDVELHRDVEIKPMSFEEAIAAGLVPAHIMAREKKG